MEPEEDRSAAPDLTAVPAAVPAAATPVPVPGPPAPAVAASAAAPASASAAAPTSASVAAAITALHELRERPLADHPDAFARIHAELQRAFAEIDDA